MKSYTDLEQSRKLAEFLPLESANMHWCLRYFAPKAGIEEYDEFPVFGYSKEYLPCWSLAALMEILPKKIEGRYTKSLYWYDDTWHCEYVDEDGAGILGISADNTIDACCGMILRLHESKKK